MVAAVAITPKDHTAAGLRDAGKRTDDADAARRMLALALVLEGKSRTEAATSCGMEALPQPSQGSRRSRKQEVAELVRKGPDLAEHGVVRWRRIDLAHVIEQRYGVKLAERSVGDLLHRLGFRRISVWPRCPEQDAAIQKTHKKTLPIWSLPPSQRTRAASRSSSCGRTRPASASKGP
jgi:transposase